MTTGHVSAGGFSDVLRDWRKRRRLSQLELSTLALISARHISFLEKGRAMPSRNMVLKLAAVMNISPGDTNVALTKAGFSTAFPLAALDDESVKPLQNAVNTMLKNHMPWPALVCDQSWKLLNTNSSADHLMEIFGAAKNDNLMQAMLSADDPEGAFINWAEVARLMLRRLDSEQLHRPTDETLLAIRTQLQTHPRLQNDEIGQTEQLSVCVPVRLRIEDKELSLISMVAQFGAIQEITYSGIHVELFFPEDEVTERHFEQLTLSS